ncbi:MAG: tetratricopeptide repeat protein [Candidatus Cloacimonadota bacterium]|nr:MAG: tetratricopeptide repeat protein [Candidatus Cloacimonadota bacterium]
MNRCDLSNITSGLWEVVLEIISPYVRGTEIGRNQPCPCGSGRKYKFCCLKKENGVRDQTDFDRCFLKSGELAFQPPRIGGYSQQETEEITTHVLRVERISQKIRTSPPEKINQLPKEKLSDCELLTLAEYYLEISKEDKAMELFAQIVESEEVDSNIDYFAIFEELINCWRKKDVDKSIYFMQHRMRKIPCNQDYDPDIDERDLADLYIAKGDNEKAIEIFKKLVNRNPDNIWNYNGAALSLIYGGEYELAEKYIKEGIKLAKKTNDPEDLLSQLKDILEEAKDMQKK